MPISICLYLLHVFDLHSACAPTLRTPDGLHNCRILVACTVAVSVLSSPHLSPSGRQVDTDDADMAAIRPVIFYTALEKLPLELAYDADRDGWSAEAFHAKVDTRGAALVVARTAGGAVVGGFNPRGWVGLGEDRRALSAFLFTVPDGDTKKPPIKLRKVTGARLAKGSARG